MFSYALGMAVFGCGDGTRSTDLIAVNPSLQRLLGGRGTHRWSPDILSAQNWRSGLLQRGNAAGYCQERALLCSGFPDLDLFGDTGYKISPTHRALGNVWFPNVSREDKRIFPLSLQDKRIVTSASHINPEPFVKEILSEELQCPVPPGRALQGWDCIVLSSAQLRSLAVLHQHLQSHPDLAAVS